jgi:hypothetical protein
MNFLDCLLLGHRDVDGWTICRLSLSSQEDYVDITLAVEQSPKFSHPEGIYERVIARLDVQRHPVRKTSI